MVLFQWSEMWRICFSSYQTRKLFPQLLDTDVAGHRAPKYINGKKACDDTRKRLLG